MTERPRPAISERSAAFWTGGAHGDLLITRCHDCGWWIHPPLPMCPTCRGRTVTPTRASGRALVWSFTIDRSPGPVGLPPACIAEVELDEQPGLRLITAIVGVDPADVTIAMAVTARFEQSGDAWIPVFAP